MANIQVKEGLEGVEFFGDVDKVVDRETGNKHVASEYPAWYFKAQVREIQDQISKIEGALDRGEVPDKGKTSALAELRTLKAKRDKIEESTPKLSDAHTDGLAKVRKELGAKLKESMFSRSDEMRGLPDAHKEFERQTMPCIKLSGDELIIAKKVNCKIYDGMVSRNDASKIWKIVSRSLGEDSNCEALRRA